MGLKIRYPWRRKQYRTTIWKNTGIRRRGDWLRLALAKGYDPIMVRIPKHLRHLSGEYFREMRLVYNKGNRHYEWHLVVDDGREPTPPPGALLGRAGDFWWTSLSMADILVDIVLAHPELPTQCRCLNQANEIEMLPAVEHDRFV
jgi:hypothetical protein